MNWWFVFFGVAGYVAAVFTWQPIHTGIVGAEEKILQLRDKIRALEKSLRGG